MLQKIVLKCSHNGDERAVCSWGSLLHGVLMELLPEETAELLHDNSMHPYSQYIIPVGDKGLEWHIGVWDDGIAEVLIKAVMPLAQITIRQKGIVLNVQSVNRSIEGENDFLARFFSDERPCRRYKIEFLTPCTHKSDGMYMLFPSVKLILQSLYMRFATVTGDICLDDDEALKQLINNIDIIHYWLHTSKYSLKGFAITGYMGGVILSVRGPEQLARLAGMLISFAEYAGIGIKTSLGMGGCRVTREFYMPAKEDGESRSNDR